MSHMLDSCGFLKSFIPPLNSYKLKDISYMFHSCFSLNELSLDKFDTSNVQDMSHLFQN